MEPATRGGREAIIRRFVAAAAAVDRDAMRDLLAPDLVSNVTRPDGSSDRLTGREAYLARVPALGSAEFTLTVPSVVEIHDDLVMAMMIVRAERGGRLMTNYAGLLARVCREVIGELWMVDALPAISEEFWH